MSLEALLASLPRDGRDFERLCKWLLTNAPQYRLLVKEAWLWEEARARWPGRWGPDAGIDVVAETFDGELWAVQAKQYAPQYAIKKADIDSFLAESSRPEFLERLLIASTDHVGPTARRTLAAQEKPVGMVLRSQLAALEVDWPSSMMRLRPARQKRKRPRPHQRARDPRLRQRTRRCGSRSVGDGVRHRQDAGCPVPRGEAPGEARARSRPIPLAARSDAPRVGHRDRVRLPRSVLRRHRHKRRAGRGRGFNLRTWHPGHDRCRKGSDGSSDGVRVGRAWCSPPTSRPPASRTRRQVVLLRSISSSRMRRTAALAPRLARSPPSSTPRRSRLASDCS